MSANLRVAFLVVLAFAFVAGANGFAKAVQLLETGPVLHPFQIACARFTFGFLTLLPFALREGRTAFRTTMPFRHALRVLFGLAGVAATFMAVGMMPIADALAIAWAFPLFTMIFAVLFLRERPGPRRWAAAFVGFVGVVVMCQPGAGVLQTGALVALAGAVFMGAEVVVIRTIATIDRPLTILTINNLMGAVFSWLLAAPVLEVPTLTQMPYMVAVGSVMVCGQMLFIRAAALGEANFVAPFSYSTLIYAAIIGWLFFSETPGMHLLWGGGLIVLSGLVIALSRRP